MFCFVILYFILLISHRCTQKVGGFESNIVCCRCSTRISHLFFSLLNRFFFFFDQVADGTKISRQTNRAEPSREAVVVKTNPNLGHLYRVQLQTGRCANNDQAKPSSHQAGHVL